MTDPALGAIASDAARWRRDLHQMPELMYDVHETAAYVSAAMRAAGVDEIVEELGAPVSSGSFAVADRPNDRPALDMDALRSVRPPETLGLAPLGKMHACGHDGLLAMLLGAARRWRPRAI